MYWINKIDTFFFKLIHDKMSTPLSDLFFSSLTDLHHYPIVKFGVAPFLIGIWLMKNKSVAVIQILVLIFGITLSDSLCYLILKPFFERPRPQYAGLEVHKKSESGTSQYGFPSNHAANCYMGATLLSSYFPTMSVPFFFIAFLIAFSRVYLGVHYPGDVIVGAIIGYFLGKFILHWADYYYLKYKNPDKVRGVRKKTLKERYAQIKKIANQK